MDRQPWRDAVRRAIFVDSSVWTDYFNDKKTSQTDWLDLSLGETLLIMGHLVPTEVPVVITAAGNTAVLRCAGFGK